MKTLHKKCIRCSFWKTTIQRSCSWYLDKHPVPFSATAIMVTEISYWQNRGSHPKGPGMASMSKHCKPHSWPLLQLAHIWLQLGAGTDISQRHGVIKKRNNSKYFRRLLFSKQKNCPLNNQINKAIQYTLTIRISNLALHTTAVNGVVSGDHSTWSINFGHSSQTSSRTTIMCVLKCWNKSGLEFCKILREEIISGLELNVNIQTNRHDSKWKYCCWSKVITYLNLPSKFLIVSCFSNQVEKSSLPVCNAPLVAPTNIWVNQFD